MKKNQILIAASLILGFGFSAFAQEGRVQIHQDSLLPQLLELKMKMGKENRLGDRYKIQIFSGDFNMAKKAKKEYDQLNWEWSSMNEYEAPNYKVWVGNFRNTIEADRALMKIRKEFPIAFKFRPEKK